MLNNVARSLVSLVRGSGIRKDYIVDDSHEIGRGRFGIVLHAQRIADGEVSVSPCPMHCAGHSD